MLQSIVNMNGISYEVCYEFDGMDAQPVLFDSIRLMENDEPIGPDLTGLLTEQALTAINDAIVKEHSCLH